MWVCTSSGRIELQMTKAQALEVSHPGQCDDDVLALSRVPKMRRQLAAIDRALLRAELAEYGAWEDSELGDHEQNLQRILWLLAGDLAEECRARA